VKRIRFEPNVPVRHDLVILPIVREDPRHASHLRHIPRAVVAPPVDPVIAQEPFPTVCVDVVALSPVGLGNPCCAGLQVSAGVLATHSARLP
jgi:hypothetical protein